MSKNKEILNKWKQEIKDYEKLTLQQSQEIYKNIINCDNEKTKKQLRDKLITGTLYIVYNFIETNGYTYMNGISYDMDDIINATIETWIKRLDSGEILNVDNLKKIITRDFYNEINGNMGINVDIDSKEYLYSIRDFIEFAADYIKIKETNPDTKYIEIIEYIKSKKEYYPLLKRINYTYYELKQYEEGTKEKNTNYEEWLKKHINEYDMSSFELLDGIIKSLESEEKVHLPKTVLYNLRFLAISNGLEYQKRNIDNITYDNLEQIIDQKELRKTLIEMIENCSGVSDVHKKIIYKRFGFLEGTPKTLEETACELDHTKEYVRQSEAKLLRKLRSPLRAKKIKEYLYK